MEWIELEKSISIDRVMNVTDRRQPTKLHDFKHLIIIVFTWEYRCLDEEFNGSAA